MKFFRKLGDTNVQMHFLPNVIHPYINEELFAEVYNGLTNSEKIVIQNDTRDYILFTELLPILTTNIIEQTTGLVKYTSLNYITNQEVYMTFSKLLCKETVIELIDPIYKLDYIDELKENNDKVKVEEISSKIEVIVEQYLEAINIRR